MEYKSLLNSKGADPERAKRMLAESLVWDNVWPVDLKAGTPVGNDWRKLDRFAAAGVNVVGVTLAGDIHNAAQALDLVAWARTFLRSNKEQYRLAMSVDDVLKAKRDGKLAVVLHFEGTGAFERNVDLIETFYALGVRQAILAFNNANAVGGGCAEDDRGLTKFGHRVVSEMQRIGMIVDLSHVGQQTSLDALAMAQAPMIFSHSNALAIHQNFRNISDEQIRRCAATGGLVGVSGASAYLGDEVSSTASIFRHLDHIVQLVGPDHASLGLDVVFDNEAVNAYVRARPDEWPMAADPAWPGFQYAMPEQLLELTGLMLDSGYSDADVSNILGGNYVRVCSAVWK